MTAARLVYKKHQNASLPKRDLPVGANLHDHFNSFVAWKAKKAVTLNDLARSPVAKLKAGMQYAQAGRARSPEPAHLPAYSYAQTPALTGLTCSSISRCIPSIGGTATSAQVAVIPDTVTFAQAATLPVAGLTALYAVEQRGGLLGRRVLVTGASGGVGHCACQLGVRAGDRHHG